MVDLRLQADITQTLELFLSPRMLQMLKVLNLPYLSLVEQINKEAEENPVMEVERADEYVEFLQYLASDKKIKKEADFTELPGLENYSRKEMTLEAHLLEQLEFEDLEDRHKKIAVEIIGNIDDHGYLLAYPQLRERIMEQFDVSRPTVDKVLKIVQGFEPEGVGARDLKECLLIQLNAQSFENAELEAVITQAIEKHLDALQQKDHKKVAADMGIPESGVLEIANFIKNNLNPLPGMAFGGGEAQTIIPSFAVEKTPKGYNIVNLETRYGPVIKFSQTYLKMLDDPKTDAQTRAFLQAKVKRAKELMEDFLKRSETLDKIVRKIIGTQGDFLERGLIWLKPLSQKSLADEFGLHPSTISRSVAEKYIQTPQGLYPLKFLCPRGPKGLTAARLKSMLVEIIKSEDKKEPMTDEQITKQLVERGADIDRRTVAYYRKELKIPAGLERTQHD